MEKMGLSDCIPRRKMKGTPNSLASILNKDMTNWSFENVKLNTSTKRNCIAIMLQLMVLLLTSTTCYKFGGKLYRQRSGLGIGLRGSAALARLVMCTWDKLWRQSQLKMGLIVQLF